TYSLYNNHLDIRSNYFKDLKEKTINSSIEWLFIITVKMMFVSAIQKPHPPPWLVLVPKT
ncbi:hypothetical protein LA314_22005, partial [Escherichia coli]